MGMSRCFLVEVKLSKYIRIEYASTSIFPKHRTLYSSSVQGKCTPYFLRVGRSQGFDHNEGLHDKLDRRI